MGIMEDKAAAEARYQQGIQRLTELSSARQRYEDQQYKMGMDQYNLQKNQMQNDKDTSNTTWTDEALQGAGLGALAGPQGALIGGGLGALLGIGKGAAYLHDTKKKGWLASLGDELFHTNQSSGLTMNNIAGVLTPLLAGQAANSRMQQFSQMMARPSQETLAKQKAMQQQAMQMSQQAAYNRDYSYNQPSPGNMGPPAPPDPNSMDFSGQLQGGQTPLNIPSPQDPNSYQNAFGPMLNTLWKNGFTG